MAVTVYRGIAPFYDLLDLPFEYGRYGRLRRILFDGLGGEILDAGIGTGRNIRFYPADARVTGVDLSPAMLARARRRAARLGRAVTFVERDIRDSGLGDDSFDAVVASFLFCVLADSLQLPALQELARIARPGAEIRILEYCWSRNPWRRFVMRLWAPWVRWAYGAAFDRDTGRYLPAAGLEPVSETFVHADIVKLIVARKPRPAGDVRPIGVS